MGSQAAGTPLFLRLEAVCHGVADKSADDRLGILYAAVEYGVYQLG